MQKKIKKSTKQQQQQKPLLQKQIYKDYFLTILSI